MKGLKSGLGFDCRSTNMQCEIVSRIFSQGSFLDTVSFHIPETEERPNTKMRRPPHVYVLGQGSQSDYHRYLCGIKAIVYSFSLVAVASREEHGERGPTTS